MHSWQLAYLYKKGMLLVGLLLVRRVQYASTQAPLKTGNVAYQDGGVATVAIMQWCQCTPSIGYHTHIAVQTALNNHSMPGRQWLHRQTTPPTFQSHVARLVVCTNCYSIRPIKFSKPCPPLVIQTDQSKIPKIMTPILLIQTNQSKITKTIASIANSNRPIKNH